MRILARYSTSLTLYFYLIFPTATDTCLLFRRNQRPESVGFCNPAPIWECCCLHTLLGPDPGSGWLLLSARSFQQQPVWTFPPLLPLSSTLRVMTRWFWHNSILSSAWDWTRFWAWEKLCCAAARPRQACPGYSGSLHPNCVLWSFVTQDPLLSSQMSVSSHSSLSSDVIMSS